MELTVTMVGGPTVVLDVGGLRIITDPTFDPPQTYAPPPGEPAPELIKTAGPALSPADLPGIDVALVSHEHVDNFDRSGRAFVEEVPGVFTTPPAAASLGSGAVGLADYQSALVPRPVGAR